MLTQICVAIWRYWLDELISSHFKDAYTQSVNTLRPRQNGRHIHGDMFTGIFLNEIYQFQLRFH